MYLFDVKQIRNVVSTVKDGGSFHTIWVLDSVGRVITDGTKENSIRNKKPDVPVVDRLIAINDKVFEEGDSNFWFGCPILDANQEVLGYVVVGVNADMLNGPMRDAISNQLSILIPALIVSIVLALWFARRITHPLTEVATVANRIGEGDWDERVLYRNRDEIGALSDSINAMAENLSQIAVSRDKAETANIAKSNFLATMSHEIRTPLNGVLGLTQLLSDTRLDEDQQRKVGAILSSGQTLLSIINDVLDMSKIEAGGIELEEKAFSLMDVISTITTPFQSLAGEKGVRLDVSSDALSVLVLKGDPVRLRQILWNLLGNAIKFTEEGTVSLAIQEADHFTDGKQLQPGTRGHVIHFTIVDTGIGISQDRIESIFDAFTQEDSSITRKYGGTGLGLSIVKRLTDLMGGSVTVDSEPGKGTTFHVYLPFGKASKQEVDAVSLRTADSIIHKTEPMNVLIAEDNEVNAVIAKAFLEKFGHSVKHVENGKLAVESAREGWADVILMDIHMPEMNGIDATIEIRSTEIGKRIPIIGLTAEAFAERHAKFIEAGMVDVLTKPYTEQQLADTLAVNRLIDRRKTARGKKPKSVSTADIKPVVEDSLEKTESVTVGSATHQIGDVSKLNAFRDQVGAETVLALLEKSQESLMTRMENLRLGLDASDAELVREVAHSIRGAGGSMYATRISELAAEIEEKSSDIDCVAKLMPEFEIAAKETLEWWRDWST